MKLVALVFFLISSLFLKCDSIKDSPCAELLTTIFNEEFFFVSRPGQMNFTAIDTITILDAGRYLSNCSEHEEILITSINLDKGSKGWTGIEIPKVETKIIKIKKEEDIPKRLLNFTPALEDSKNPYYRCFFILKKFEVNGDEVFIQLDKLISSHSVRLTYRKEKKGWSLLAKEVGQY